jgi:hypothetical protein
MVAIEDEDFEVEEIDEEEEASMQDNTTPAPCY